MPLARDVSGVPALHTPMSLVTIADARTLIATGLSDEKLQEVIDRAEQAVIERFGEHYVDADTTVSDTLEGGSENLYLRRRITSVESIQEATLLGSTPATLEATTYFVWGMQGRIQRLYAKWGKAITVQYVPYNDNAKRKDVIIGLIRLELERTAMKSESIAGEYSFSAPDWEVDRARLLRRLGFLGL